MADNVTLPFTGAGDATPKVATDEIAGVHHQRVKMEFGAEGSATDVSLADPLPVQGTITVQDGGGSLTVDGTVTVTDGGGSITVDAASLPLPLGAATAALQTQPGVDIGDVTINNAAGASAVNIQDGGNSITVDNTVLSVVGGGSEATAQRVTIANDSTGVLSVDDNGGSLTVDGTVAISGTVPVSDAGGSLTVDGTVAVSSVGGTVAVSNAGTFAVQDSQAITDNAPFTDGTSKVIASGFVYDEVAGTALSENDAAAARINANRAQVHAIEDGVTRGRYATVSATNALKVDGSAVTQPVSGTVAVSGLPSGANTIGGVTVTAGLPTGANTIGAIASIVAGLPTGANTIGAVAGTGTFAMQDSQVTTDNGTFTDGTTKLFTAGFVYDEVAGTALTENDAAAARIDVKRAQIHTIEDGVTRGRYATVTAANAVKVDGSGVTQPVSGTVTVGNASGGSAVNIQDGGNSITVDGTVTVAAITAGLPTGANTIGTVAISGTVPVSGTVAVSAIAAGLPTGANTIGAVTISGGLSPSSNNIGDVDVLTMPGTAANNAAMPSVLQVVAGVDLATNTVNALRMDTGNLLVQGEVLISGGSVTSIGGIQHDSSATGTNPVLVGGYSSAAAPTSVSADGDAVNAWYLRNGAQATVLTAAGALIGGDATNGLDVDVTRLPGLPTGANTIGAISSIIAGLPTGANTIGAVTNGGTFATQETGGGVISTVNSNTTPLAISGVFTGTAEDITNYATATVTVFSNQASATDGLSMQQSSDGTNWDNVDVFTIPASTGKSFGVQCAARYFRVVYTNGGSAQATFRLQTIYHRFSQRTAAVRPQDARTNDNDFNETISYLSGYNGTTWDRLRSDTTNGLDVDVTRIAAGLPTGANTIGAIASIVAGLPTSANTIGAVNGTIAHGTADSTNPHKMGAKAIAHGTNPTAVAAAARTDLYANRAGVLFTMGGHPNIQTIRANYTAAQTDTALVTIGAGLKAVVTRCSVTVANSTTVDVAARVGFGTASTPTGAGTILSHPGLAKGCGMVEGNGSGILGVGADNEEIRVTCTVPTTGSVDVVVSYFTIES